MLLDEGRGTTVHVPVEAVVILVQGEAGANAWVLEEKLAGEKGVCVAVVGFLLTGESFMRFLELTVWLVQFSGHGWMLMLVLDESVESHRSYTQTMMRGAVC